jgi:Tfp pilus assembly protein PilN
VSNDDPHEAPSVTSPTDAAPRRLRNPWVWVSGVLALIAVGLLVWALAATSDRDSAQHELTSTQQQLDTTNQELDQTKQDEQQQESSEASTDESDGSGGAVAAVGGLAAANRCTTT